jgi:purine-binding chemotaxis protein CheW
MAQETVETDAYIEGQENESMQLVVFQLGGEEFGVDIMQVQEIIRMHQGTRIPQAPDYVKGVINIRGNIIVVINLEKILDLPTKEEDDDNRIIVVEIGGNILGMTVDSVSEVLSISKSNVEPAPDMITSKINSDFIKGVGKLDDRLLILLDLENVLTIKQLADVSEVSAARG